MSDLHRKQSHAAPDGYFAWEAAGLRWLTAAPHGAAVVAVRGLGAHHLDLERLTPVRPTAAAARDLGAALVRTHAAGATAWGAAPDGWEGDGWFGPLSDPLPLRLGSWPTWGLMYAEARVAPLTALARDRGVLDGDDVAVLDQLCARLVAGHLDTDDEPARIHGDLWSGNLLWTDRGGVLIDPAAHGGHRETDLALLALFGAPRLAEVLEGYEEQAPLADGWRGRVQLHQVHCLLVHAVLFGGGYRAAALEAAGRYV